jgi:hypothetical protein
VREGEHIVGGTEGNEGDFFFRSAGGFFEEFRSAGVTGVQTIVLLAYNKTFV